MPPAGEEKMAFHQSAAFAQQVFNVFFGEGSTPAGGVEFLRIHVVIFCDSL